MEINSYFDNTGVLNWSRFIDIRCRTISREIRYLSHFWTKNIILTCNGGQWSSLRENHRDPTILPRRLYRSLHCRAIYHNIINNIILFKFREHVRFAEISAVALVFVAFRSGCSGRVQRTLGLARPIARRQHTFTCHRPNSTITLRGWVWWVGGEYLSRNGLT